MKQGGLLQDIAAVLDRGVDFSPVVAIIALQLVQRLVLQLLIGILV